MWTNKVNFYLWYKKGNPKSTLLSKSVVELRINWNFTIYFLGLWENGAVFTSIIACLGHNIVINS